MREDRYRKFWFCVTGRKKIKENPGSPGKWSLEVFSVHDV